MHREYTISQVIQYTESLEKQLIAKLIESSGKAPVLYKRFINRCNSLVIVLSQFEIKTAAFDILHKALQIDLKTHFTSEIIPKSWKGRVLLYINTGYLMFLIGDYTSSLKFLYDAESLLLNADPSAFTTKDLLLTHSIITSLVLFKAKRLESAEKQVKIASQEFNEIIRGDRLSKFNKNSCYNIYCLLTLFVEVLKAHITGLESSINSKKVAKQLKKLSPAGLVLLEDFNAINSIENGSNLIGSYEYRSIMVASVLFPFIVKSTPILQMNELRKAKDYNDSRKISKSQLANYIGKPMRSLECRDFYAILMTEGMRNSYNFN